MPGIFNLGEQKIRPGNYYRFTTQNSRTKSSQQGGAAAVAFIANWGPLGQVIELAAESEITKHFGTSGNLDALRNCLRGGASKVIACRVGTGGTKAAITLKDTATTPANALTLESLYVGTRPLSITIRDYLADATLREAILYSGTTELLKVTFTKGTAEASSLIAALNSSNVKIVSATLLAEGNGTLAALTQSAFTAGTNPTTPTTTDYSNALTVLETANWDTICVDTDDPTVHAIVKAYMTRVVSTGKLGMSVVGEPTSIALATRQAHAAAFDSPYMAYVLNGFYDQDGNAHEGWKAAAVVAGMIAAYPSNTAITHKAIPNAESVFGALKNDDIEACIRAGAIVFTTSRSGAVWVESGVNTLITLSDDQDAGWKKIRRVKCRYELISRIQEATEKLIGDASNNSDGRSAFIALANGVAKAMASETKLVSCIVYEDPDHLPEGDSAHFLYEVVDLDSLERTYGTFVFQFSGA